jgi:hypothetical protein
LGIACRRLAAVADIPGLKEAAIKSNSDPIQRVLANLAKRGVAKPRTLKTLQSSIKNLLGVRGTEEAVGMLVGELERLNTIKITDGKVSYPA